MRPSPFLSVALGAILFARIACAQTGPEQKAIVSAVTDPERIRVITEELQKKLTHSGNSGHIEKCEHLIDFTFAKSDGRDSSFGATCDLTTNGTQTTVLMCDDLLLGKFTMGGSDPHSLSGVTEFVRHNCPPGG